MSGLISFFSTYIYLLSALYFLLWWIVLFISLRKHRAAQKKILILSVLFAIATPFIEHLNLYDWWSPVFVWNMFFHIEDLLFGFGITGTALGIYFWASERTRTRIEQEAVFSPVYRSIALTSAALLIFVLFYIARLSSFYAETACMLLISACVFARVPVMIRPAIITGIILVVIILPGYFIGTWLHPGWIQEYWKLAGWPAQLFLTVPIGEYVFYICSGLFIPAFGEVLFAKSQG
jgi:hypothetical protein